MTRAQFAVTLVAAGLFGVVLSGCGRRTEITEAPVPEAVRHETGEVPPVTDGGASEATDFRVPDGCVVSPENDKAEGEAGYRTLHEETGMELVYVPGGTFMMGSGDGDESENPVHEVELSGYWIGRTEVTCAQWSRVIGTQFVEGVEYRPSAGNSWPVCQAFCEKLALRLPTEAEWEYAARGPEGYAYPWGNEWDAARCHVGGPDNNKEPWLSTEPVASYPSGASWCGAMDMAGNVSEWCQDWYSGDFYASEEAAGVDPVCAEADFVASRAVRGGDWRSEPDSCRSFVRGCFGPDSMVSTVGFRVARNAD